MTQPTPSAASEGVQASNAWLFRVHAVALWAICLLAMVPGVALAETATEARIVAPNSSQAVEEIAREEQPSGQDDDEKAVDESTLVERVVVTAQRREEELQKVPMAVTTVDEEDLDRSSVGSTFGLDRRTTGFVFSTNAVWGQPFIRGIGTDIVGIGTDSSVATHVDGVYQARQIGSIQDYFDVERVEMLKGPQGTLYGRNATGGSINVISRPPVPGFQAAGDIVFGNFSRSRIRGMTNIPLKKEKAFFRLSFLKSEHDGFMENLLTGTTVDDEDLRTLRGQVRFFAAENKVDVTLGAYIHDERDTRTLSLKVDPTQPSPAVDLFGGTVPEDPREGLFNSPYLQDGTRWGLNAKVIWNTSAFSLTSLTGYTETDFFGTGDLDGTEVHFISNDGTNEDSQVISQEIQFASRGDTRSQWIAGLFFLRENATQDLDINLPLAGIRNQPISENTTNAWAVFGQGSFYLTTKLRGTAGLRFSAEDKHHLMTQLINEAPIGAEDQKDSWNALTPRLGLEYFANKNAMIFASAARGFKSGGFNSLQLQDGFDPEYVWSYEAGAKTSLVRNRLVANFHGFYYDYTDIQLQRWDFTQGALPTVSNAGRARLTGLEAEFSGHPTEQIRFDVGVASLNAKYTEFISNDPNNPGADPDQSGNRMPRAPKLSATAGFEYRWTIGSAGFLSAFVGYKYQSHVFFDPYENAAVAQGAYSVWDGRLRFDDRSETWYLAIQGSNLSDELYAQNAVADRNVTGTVRIWAPPRAVGVVVGARY